MTCRSRFRGPNEAHDDAPNKQDELDEPIYGVLSALAMALLNGSTRCLPSGSM